MQTSLLQDIKMGAIVDVETTGMSPRRGDEVVEIGLILFRFNAVHHDEVEMSSWSRVEHDLFSVNEKNFFTTGVQLKERNQTPYIYQLNVTMHYPSHDYKEFKTLSQSLHLG